MSSGQWRRILGFWIKIKRNGVETETQRLRDGERERVVNVVIQLISLWSYWR